MTWVDDTWPAGTNAVHGSVADRLAAVAIEHRDRPALRGTGRDWTHHEMWADVTATASGLIDRIGADRPRHVAVLAAHDAPLVVTVLAVMAAGHVVLVIDPVAPTDAQTTTMAECGPVLLVHDHAHAEMAAALAAWASPSIPTVPMDELAGPPVTLPVRHGGDPAMLAMTSGTSGTPKAAVITHSVLLNVCRGATMALGVTATDRMPMLFPVSMAVAAYPMLLPLLNGGLLVPLDVRSVGLAPVADFLIDERITVVYMAPTVLRFMTESLAGREFPDLRLVALGGELVDDDAVRLTRDLLKPRQVAIGFGTTETGLLTLGIVADGPLAAGSVPAGHAVPGVTVNVEDDRGNRLPSGQAGEIVVASPYLFTGYHGHPELSAAVLQPDEHRPGWVNYRTGDLGTLDAEGTLTVLGRIDTKVKVRGRFVDPGEVETSVRSLPVVRDVAVVAVTEGGVTELAAVVVTEPSADPAALRSALLDREESYRVPSRWVVVAALPQLPNGKLDRRAILSLAHDGERGRTPEGATGGNTTQASAPTGAVDPAADGIVEAVREIWTSLLPVGPVGLDDDFMSCGGDSLAAAQMLILVEQRLGTIVPMGELVHARTLREFVDVVRTRSDSTAVPLAQCVSPGDPGTRPRLWFFSDLQGSAYRLRHLAQNLGADQPLWSFESPLLFGEANRFSSLDTFVARMLHDLTAIQPEGPYWLAGYSFGGICAYEMARQLRRDGHEVAFLGVIDVGPGYRGEGWHSRRSPFRPWFGVAKPPPADATPMEVVSHYRAMWAASPARFGRHLMVRSGLARLVDPVRFRSDIRRHGRLRPEWRLWYAWEEHWKLAARGWNRSSTYDGPMDLFWTADSGSVDATMGWEPLVPSVDVHRFAGHHDGILEPEGAPALAAVLRRVMDERWTS